MTNTPNSTTPDAPTRINPWMWQDQLGFSQAIAVPGQPQWLICAGQGAVDEDGTPTEADDMRGQIDRSFDNPEHVLEAAGFNLADVVRLNLYTTDVAALFAAYDRVLDRLSRAGIQPASTLLGVAGLALPGMQIEIDATACRL